MELSPRGARDR